MFVSEDDWLEFQCCARVNLCLFCEVRVNVNVYGGGGVK